MQDTIPIADISNAFAVFQAGKVENTALIEALRTPRQPSGALARPVTVLTTVHEAEAYFDRQQGREVIAVYVAPDVALASSLAAGAPLAEALEECQNQVLALLDLLHRGRGLIILIELIAAEANPDILARVLQARMGHAFPGVTALSPPKQKRSSGLHYALASLALLERPQLRRQCAELEASTIPISPGERHSLSEMAFKELLKLQGQARQAENNNRLTEQYDALLEQLFKLESDLERAEKRQAETENLHAMQLSEAQLRIEVATKENHALVQQRSELKQLNHVANQQRSELKKLHYDVSQQRYEFKKLLARVKDEKLTLAKQFAEAQLQIEIATKENHDLVQQRSELKQLVERTIKENLALVKQLSDAQNTAALVRRGKKKTKKRLDAARASISWRVTGPVRRFGRKLHRTGSGS